MAARTDHSPGPDPSPPPTPGSSCTPGARGFQTKSLWVQQHLGPHPGPPWAPHKSTSNPLTDALAALGTLGPCSCPPGAGPRTWGSKASGATGPPSLSCPIEEGVASTRMLVGLQTPPEVESSTLGTSGQPGPRSLSGARVVGCPEPLSFVWGLFPRGSREGPGEWAPHGGSKDRAAPPGGRRLSSLGEVTSLGTALQGARAHPLQRCKHRGLQRTACPRPSVVAGTSCPGATQEGKSRRACHGDRTQEAGRGTPALPPHPGGSPPGPCLAPHAPGAPAVSVS